MGCLFLASEIQSLLGQVSDDRNKTTKIMNMEIRKRLVHLLGGKTPDEMCHAVDAAVRTGKYVAFSDVLEKFERHGEVTADELCECIKLFIQLKLRELRNRK